MEILFQSHHAKVSDRLRERARIAVTKLGARLARAVNAVVRFEEDGPTRRVEIVLHAPKKRAMVAEGSARFFGPALRLRNRSPRGADAAAQAHSPDAQ